MESILVSDFDGTITLYDFYDLVCAKYPDITRDYWSRYEEGKITHFEALRSIFAGIRADEDSLNKVIEQMQIDLKFTDSLNKLKKNGWEVVVASAGCDWYIKRLLNTNLANVTVYANPGNFDPAKGLSMCLPYHSRFFSEELGINKVDVVRDAISRSKKVAFAGDGRPDLAPALLVPSERRYAKKWLAKKLKEIGEEFKPFEKWSEICEDLMLEK